MQGGYLYTCLLFLLLMSCLSIHDIYLTYFNINNGGLPKQQILLLIEKIFYLSYTVCYNKADWVI